MDDPVKALSPGASVIALPGGRHLPATFSSVECELDVVRWLHAVPTQSHSRGGRRRAPV